MAKPSYLFLLCGGAYASVRRSGQPQAILLMIFHSLVVPSSSFCPNPHGTFSSSRSPVPKTFFLPGMCGEGARVRALKGEASGHMLNLVRGKRRNVGFIRRLCCSRGAEEGGRE